MFKKYFSDALIKARLAKKMTKHQVAESFGWLGMYYGRFEKGHILPTAANIGKFANFMDMTVEEVQKLIDMERESHLKYLAERDSEKNALEIK